MSCVSGSCWLLAGGFNNNTERLTSVLKNLVDGASHPLPPHLAAASVGQALTHAWFSGKLTRSANVCAVCKSKQRRCFC